MTQLFLLRLMEKTYTHNYDLKAIRLWIEKYPDLLHYIFSKRFVRGRTKIIPENNNGTFNDDFYGQISGRATNTIFTPTYPILTMGYFDVYFYNIFELKWGKEIKEFILENWSCFLDDCQTPLDKNKVKPKELLETLNSFNEAIWFTMEFSDKKILFPNVLLKQDNSGVWVDLY